MAPNILHLPNGQTITVTSVYGGLYFKSNDLSTHQQSHMPPGWTIVLHSEDDEDEIAKDPLAQGDDDDEENIYRKTSNNHIHRYRKPTLRNDAVFISSISNPSNSDFKPAVSQTRGIAMMLWATLWWYFHQPQPAPQSSSAASAQTADSGKPHGEWRIRVKREGIFKAKHLLPKLERMGLVATDTSSVGVEDERHNKAWDHIFISQRAFWQIDARIFLFTLSPTHSSPLMPSTPMGSRPSSPSRGDNSATGSNSRPASMAPDALAGGLWSPSLATGPFSSSSHLPTYYPPHPAQYLFTNGIRHPLRPKPPRQGETIYTRYIPSLGQYLSFRVASLSTDPVPHKGPVGSPFGAGMTFGASTGHAPAITPPGSSTPQPSFLPPSSAMRTALHSPPLPAQPHHTPPSDLALLNKWHNDPRVAAFWGESGPMSHTESFLRAGLTSKHSFPVIGCFDGRPFGYFELYWVKEDHLGPLIDRGKAGDWDRGIHALVGEQEFRGPNRVKVWLSALVHYFWLQDARTEHVWCEPRIDNTKFIQHLADVGFKKEGEVTFPHKQSALMGISRDQWISPAL